MFELKTISMFIEFFSVILLISDIFIAIHFMIFSTESLFFAVISDYRILFSCYHKFSLFFFIQNNIE